MLEISISSQGSFLNVNSTGNNTLKRSVIPNGTEQTNSREVQRILNDMKAEFAIMVQEDITMNIMKGMKYTGSRAAALKKSTIKRKGNSRIFIETGRMLRGVKVKKIGSVYRVFMSKERYNKRGKSRPPTVEEVAGYINEGTERMTARPFFGLTKKKSELFFAKLMKKYSRELSNVVLRKNKKQITAMPSNFIHVMEQ